jgi:hypothetical protein
MFALGIVSFLLNANEGRLFGFRRRDRPTATHADQFAAIPTSNDLTTNPVTYARAIKIARSPAA